MLIIRCANCGNDITNMAGACPRCNAPIPIPGAYQPYGYGAPPQYYQHFPQPPPQKLSQPGKKMISVTAIILTISGGLSLLFALNSFVSTSVMNELFIQVGISGSFLYTNIWSCITAAVMLAFGIFGIKNSGNVEKARTIVIMGIVLIALNIASCIISVIIYTPLFSAGNLSSLYSQFNGSAIVSDLVTDMVSSMVVSVIIAGVIMGAAFGCVLPILYIIGGRKLQKNSAKAG